MKIHSLTGCACWNWGESHNPPMREVYRRNIREYGHTEGCPHHHVMSMVVRMHEKRVVKDPSLVCCYACAGQGKYHTRSGSIATCPTCGGKMQDRERLLNRFRPPPVAERLLSANCGTACRKRHHDRSDTQWDARIKHERRHGDRNLAAAWAAYYFERGDVGPMP